MPLPKTSKKWLAACGIGLAVFITTMALHANGLLTIAELKSLDHRFNQYADPDAAGAKAIVFDILFLEPDANDQEFDAVLAEEVRAAENVFFPFLLQHDPPPALSAPLLTKATIPVDSQPERLANSSNPYQGMKLPIPSLTEAARGLGHITLTPDPDGTMRRLPPLVQTMQGAVPQLATAVARYLLRAERAVQDGHTLRLGLTTVPITRDGDIVLDWHGALEQKTYPAYSIGAVLRSYTEMQKGERPLLDPALFKDKVVFVGTTAAGTYDLRVTPLSPFTPGVLIQMTALDNLLRSQAIAQAPPWAFVLTTLVLCIGTAWAFVLVQRQALKFLLIAGLALAYYGLVIHAFTDHDVWMELVFPEGALALAYAVSATVEYLTEGRQRRVLRAAFDKYMSAEVVDEIMRNPESIKLGGEKKELTVFFSDVAGFTTISEKLDPEDLVFLLNEYLSSMTDIIRRYRGNVNKYLGDGIMAIFGAPRSEPTHASLACFAALEYQAALARLREGWTARGYPEMIARIGINSGPLVVGNMGSQARMEYTVMGDSVNLASRLEGANKFYATLILLGPRTYELAKPDIEAREVDILRVKGKLEPVVVYELLARKGALPAEKQHVVALYQDGLAAYKQREFTVAKERFEAALALDPSDGPTKVYLHRVQEYLATPPPPDWDGVYVLKSK
ncbi:MAG: adenylate/guanylate cyclase domain-containing protein [Nitrospirae bacterium]|nr:MAG: adenylate/guanylate cyclase domain-containing protein [Nitrospirota bacterium]